jgi:hypothetical protein
MEAKHVFKYNIWLKNDIDHFRRCIYTNIDFCEKHKEKNSSERDEWHNMHLVEDEIEKIYFTKEEIDKLKYELCERIMSDPNPFSIYCSDWDGGYEVDESELLENIRTIKQ